MKNCFNNTNILLANVTTPINTINTSVISLGDIGFVGGMCLVRARTPDRDYWQGHAQKKESLIND